MRVSRNEIQTQAFVLKWDDLARIYSRIAGILPRVNIDAACKDKLSRRFTDLDELQRFGNPQRRAIESLRLTARSQDLEDSFSLSFDAKDTRNIRISIDGSEKDAEALSEIVNDAIDSLVPWYSWIAKTNWYWLLVGLFWLALFCLPILILVIRGSITLTTGDLTKIDRGPILTGCAMGLVPGILGGLLNLVRSRLFPMGSFAFGYGEALYLKQNFLRSTVVVAFVISVVASVVAAWLVS